MLDPQLNAVQDIACSSLPTLLLTPQPNPFTISDNCYIVTVEVLTLLTYSTLYIFTFLPRTPCCKYCNRS